MTPKQIEQYNRMLATLRKISKDYMTPDQIRKNQQTPFDASEEIEMAYENIQEEARFASRGLKFIATPEQKSKLDFKMDSIEKDADRYDH